MDGLVQDDLDPVDGLRQGRRIAEIPADDLDLLRDPLEVLRPSRGEVIQYAD